MWIVKAKWRENGRRLSRGTFVTYGEYGIGDSPFCVQFPTRGFGSFSRARFSAAEVSPWFLSPRRKSASRRRFGGSRGPFGYLYRSSLLTRLELTGNDPRDKNRPYGSSSASNLFVILTSSRNPRSESCSNRIGSRDPSDPSDPDGREVRDLGRRTFPAP